MALRVLVLDGLNLMHRARSGFQLGDYNVVYNFFRGLKPLVERFGPNRAYLTLEGHPRRRYELLPEYKANRLIDRSTEQGETKWKSLQDFYRQRDLIVGLLERHFPISVVQHPEHEGDDVIANIVRNASLAVEFTVVSTDGDFTQLLQERSNVRLYHPVDKRFVSAPEYDYVTWKAICGDGSDNVPALPGADVDVVQQLLLDEDPEPLRAFLLERAQGFARNVELVRFAEWSREEAMAMRSSSPSRDWDAVRASFEAWEFRSMLREPYWSRFVGTFDTLWAA